MIKSLVVGILREDKNEWEKRAPLSPSDVKWLVDRGISVEVESDPKRVFSDKEYRAKGARVLDRFKKASLFVGIKEPELNSIKRNGIYMIFSHTTKGQSYNMPLLKELRDKRAVLIDYERITDAQGKRLVYFGRFAGICGMTDSLSYIGRKLRWKGIDNPFMYVKPAWQYESFNKLEKDVKRVGGLLRRNGFDRSITPFIIGITGHGNVSGGVQEVLDLLHPVEIPPRDLGRFVRGRKHLRNKIYKIIFSKEEKLRSKSGEKFYFEEYLNYPDRFESNLDGYLPHLNMLIHGSYWDRRYPRIVPKDMIRRLYKEKDFRLDFIGDISCDIRGSIELTREVTSSEKAVYTYNPEKNRYVDGYEADGITILSVDNLPAELPKDASRGFGKLIRDYVYRIAVNGTKNVTDHTEIPAEIRKAVVTQKGKLTEYYQYLKKHLV